MFQNHYFAKIFYCLSFVLYGIHLIVDVINEYVLPTVVVMFDNSVLMNYMF